MDRTPSVLDKDELLKAFDSYSKKRVTPYPIFDQVLATKETIIERVSIMHENLDIQNKKIVFIGDDDFMSVCCAITGLPKEILVIDIDSRIIRSLETLLKDFDIPFKLLNLDLRKQLPSDILDRYDTFFGDPPYTMGGVGLFLTRGFECLKDDGIGYTCIPSRKYAGNVTDEIISNIGSMGISIIDVWEDKNNYIRLDENSGVIMPKGFSSTLLRVRQEKLSPNNKKTYGEEIYAYKVYDASDIKV